MMTTPDVSYSRPMHPDKIPRPPPKSFSDFQSATDAAKNPDSVKQSFVPKPGATEPSATFGDQTLSQAELRMGLLEQRIEQLEGELEELTDAATKPAKADASAFIADWVRVAVVDGLVAPEVALLVIARRLGIVDVSTKPQAPAPSFRPAPVGPRIPPPPTRDAKAPKPEPDDGREEAEEESGERRGSDVPPGKKYAGRPSQAMRKAQEAPRKAINALMAAHGISQAKIERLSGVPQGALSRWLRGGVAFDPTFIPRVEKAIKKLV